MMYLIFDTETTGFPRPELPPEDPQQARLCQLALILVDHTYRPVFQYSTLIELTPEIIMNPGALKVHNITPDMGENYGVRSDIALSVFHWAAQRAEFAVAYNAPFDKQILDIEWAYYDLKWPVPEYKCAMEMTGRRQKLSQAYYGVTGKQVENAHDAMADTLACLEVFKHYYTPPADPADTGGDLNEFC